MLLKQLVFKTKNHSLDVPLTAILNILLSKVGKPLLQKLVFLSPLNKHIHTLLHHWSGI